MSNQQPDKQANQPADADMTGDDLVAAEPAQQAPASSAKTGDEPMMTPITIAGAAMASVAVPSAQSDAVEGGHQAPTPQTAPPAASEPVESYVNEDEAAVVNPSRHDLLPRGQLPLTALAISMSVMCYLACLAIGAMVLITHAVNEWDGEIGSEMTVQVKPVLGEDLALSLVKAQDLIRQMPGIKNARLLGEDETEKLLEPWIGSGAILHELPIPRLIAVTIDQNNPPDIDLIASRLTAEVPGATLDTHRRWQAELTRMATTMRWLGATILILIILCTSALVTYASRAAIEANRHVVEVLHLVGASDGFIAHQVQKRFVQAGLQAGIAAAVAGIITFAIIALSGGDDGTGLAQASRSLVYGTAQFAVVNYLLFLMVPVMATLICVMTARYAILHILKNVY